MSSQGAAPRCLLANMTCINTVNSTCPFRTTSWKSFVAVMQRSASSRSSNLSICRQHIFRCLSESSHCPHLHQVLFDRFDLDLSMSTRPSAQLSSVCKPSTDVVVSVWRLASSNSVVVCTILARCMLIGRIYLWDSLTQDSSSRSKPLEFRWKPSLYPVALSV